MNAAAARLTARILFYHALVAVTFVVLLVTQAPALLLLGPLEAQQAVGPLVIIGVTSQVLSMVVTRLRLIRLRYTLRALALGSPAYEADDLTELSRLPSFVAFRSLGFSTLAALLVTLPAFVSARVDTVTVVYVVLLAVIIIAAASLPLYALVRSAVTGALQLADPDRTGDVLGALESGGEPRRRVVVHLGAAVALPLLVMATGTALVALAHVRNEAALARVETAVALARVLDDAPGPLPAAGRDGALARAAGRGFDVRLENPASNSVPTRDERGRRRVSVALGAGRAEITVDVAPYVLGPIWGYVVFAALVGLGAWLGGALGSSAADDLVAATLQVRHLSNEASQRFSVPPYPARYAVVAEIGEAAATLTYHFRVFADAQERTIESRAAALRLRGLLFASVSHDLKTPLNAVLGFCAVASTEPLNDLQLESLRIIERRGRELLALIETILDAARVEAQRLRLARGVARVRGLLEQAVLRGDELGPVDAAPVIIEARDDLPEVFWDEARVAQAIAAVVGHAKRLSPMGGVRVVATREGDDVRIEVVDPSESFSLEELGRLLDARHAATAPRRLGGLALGLSLARALVTLHGGTLDVGPLAGGGAVFHFVLPIAPPRI